MRRHRTWIGFILLTLSLLIGPPFTNPNLHGAEPTPSPATRKNLVILGDSIAAGYGLDPGEAYPAQLQRLIDQAGLPWHVINAGVSGDTTAGGLRRLAWLLRQPLDALIIELGGNDGLRGLNPANTRTNLQAIIDTTRKARPNALILLTGMRMPPNMGAEYLAEFEAAFPAIAKTNHLPLVPFLLEGVGGIDTLNQPDRIHPTAEGQRLVATNIWTVLEPELRRLQPR